MGTPRTETRAMSRTIGENLHRYFDSLVKDPLPERWVQLVQRLNSEASRCLSPRFNAASSRPDRSLNLGERLRKKRSSRKMLHGGSPFRQPSSPKGGG